MKSLIFIVAYNAEAHLESVFRRIPYDRLPAGCEMIVIDDASPDGTFEVGQKAAESCPIPVRVLKNPKNLGYGGNQKVGYQIAIQEEFTAVVMVHGDGQYAPELLPEMLAPVLDENADVVLGSRMLRKKDALAGGMPIYKWIGNQVLTKLENRIVGSNLSEFHTGYRTYRIGALKRIPFHHNTNDFHFDTDILIQLLRIGAVFREIPIPTHYGEEICRVNGWRYFYDCIRSCWHDWLTQKGIFYSRRFDICPPSTRYESKIQLQHSSHQFAIKMIGDGVQVLDIGGGNGWIADHLAGHLGCKVTIIDTHFRKSPPLLHATIEHDLSEDIDFELPDAKVVLMLDVIEHLPRQRQILLLDRLRQRYDDGDVTMVISVPNTAFLPIRLVFLLLGRLNYGRRGILDDTHAFLFTKSSLRQLMEECGYDVISWHQTPPPYVLALGDGRFARLATSLHAKAASFFPSLLAFQNIVAVAPRATVATLVKRGFENSASPPAQ
jgi:glycosyltransferase involved in cell wall biosynthesis